MSNRTKMTNKMTNKIVLKLRNNQEIINENSYGSPKKQKVVTKT